MDTIRDDKYNYGIALLRMLMCFEVVLNHFWVNQQGAIVLAPFGWMKGLAVPVFMFLAFYFSKPTFFTKDSSKKSKRIWRLTYPQIVWTIIYWLPVCLLLHEVGIKDLFWQLFTGHSPKLNPTMWFQTVLIVLTLIYFLIFRLLSERNGLILLCAIAAAALWFQYSGHNYDSFGSMRFELSYPLGRFFEMIPYATLGLATAYFDLFGKMKSRRVLSLTVLGLASIFFIVLGSKITSAPGFGYSNYAYLPAVFFTSGFAYLLPLKSIPDKARQILRFVTRYTLGIYCMHRLIGIPLSQTLNRAGIAVNGFTLSIIIYIIAFGVSYIIARVSPKYLRPIVE